MWVFEPSCPYLNLSIFLFARLNRWHEPLGAVRTVLARFKSIWTVPYFQLQGWTSLYNFEPREPAFYNGFLVVESNFSRRKSNVFFFENFPRSPEGPEADVTEAEDSLESLQTEKEEKEAGARDPENMDWI